jgi:hypothetical protein
MYGQGRFAMTKKIYTVIVSCVAVVLTHAIVVAPAGAAATADGRQGHSHAVSSRRHRAARKKTAVRPAVSYVCPMHPDTRSNAPGTCPKCLMELVQKDAKQGAASVKKSNN